MIFFKVYKNIEAESFGFRNHFIAPPNPDEPDISAQYIYCTTLTHYIHLENTVKKQDKQSPFRILPESAIRSHTRFPTELGVSTIGELERDQEPSRVSSALNFKKLSRQLESFNKNRTLKIAIINGLGGGIGDSLVGFTALRSAHRILSGRFNEIQIDCLLIPGVLKRLLPLYDQEAMIHKTTTLPIGLDSLFTYDAFFDFSGFISLSKFNDLCLVDFFLFLLGIDPKRINGGKKRNLVRLNETIRDQTKLCLDLIRNLPSNISKKLLLFHPKSSSRLRDIPFSQWAQIIRTIINKTDYTVVSAVSIDFVHDRFADISQHSNSPDRFCAIISQVDAIITADTSVYHIADSFNIPTVVLFPTIPPDLRIKYYPSVKGILLDGADQTPYYKKHKVFNDLPYDDVIELWDRLDTGEILLVLTETIETTATNITFIICPLCQSRIRPQITDAWLEYDLYECPVCVGEFASPMKTTDYESAFRDSQTQSPDYTHYVRDGRTREEVITNLLNQFRYKKITSFFRQFSIKRTHLDIGCANGAFPTFTLDIGFDSYGIDIAGSAIDYGKHVLGHPNLAQASSLEELPDHFPKEFQIITSFELVEHLEDPNGLARQVWAHLEEKGYWIFSTPNRDRLYFRLGLRNTKKHRGLDGGDFPPEHLSRWRAKTHRIFIERNGFELVDQYTTPMVAETIIHSIGELPNMQIEFSGKKQKLDRGQITNTLFHYLRPLFNLIDGYGNFLITIARKQHTQLKQKEI